MQVKIFTIVKEQANVSDRHTLSILQSFCVHRPAMTDLLFLSLSLLPDVRTKLLFLAERIDLYNFSVYDSVCPCYNDTLYSSAYQYYCYFSMYYVFDNFIPMI